MATKRPAPDAAPSNLEDGIKKRRKPNEQGGRSFKRAHTVNETKAKIRSLRRLLERNERLPADVRVEKERALQTAEYELRRTQHAKQRSDMIARYHKIRFFDRQKAVKRLKKAKKSLSECENEGQRRILEKEVGECEVDQNYAQYYPLELAYVPLFPTKKGDKEKAKDGDDGKDVEHQNSKGLVGREGDDAMREKVRQSMREGTLDALRNSRLIDSNKGNQNMEARSKNPESAPKPSSKRDSQQEPAGDDEDSDGGFF
ncbi:hypothetical protein K431DRAFT_287803, partial [Polychaeton citri CBS 116435]